MMPRLALSAAVWVGWASLTAQATPSAPALRKVDVDHILATMSTEEKVGQLMIVGFGGTSVDATIKHWVRDRRVGGVALFSRNIVDLEQTARFTRALAELTDDYVPIFIALDQEGGNVVRVKDGAMLLPGNMALGATRSPTRTSK
jgi:beta-N-acetylhexosaminidase